MKKFSQTEQILFAKRLSFLICAGVPIVQALAVLSAQAPQSLAVIYQKIFEEVSGGRFLSAAMKNLSYVFSEFAISIIKVGEEGGILGENLQYLADEMKKRRLLKKKIIGALFYPLFIAFATCGITLALTVFIFPKVLPVFASMKAVLPMSTRILMFISHLVIAYAWLLALAAVFLFLIFMRLLKLPPIKKFCQAVCLRLPAFGSMFRHYYLANFCRSMGLLLKHDSRLDKVLLISADGTASLVYREQFIQMADQVRQGGKISAYASANKHFPIMFSHMLEVGEAAGNLSETFLYLAEIYEQEVDELAKNLSELIEPFLMVFMGLLVGFVAMSIILPIYSITEKLKP